MDGSIEAHRRYLAALRAACAPAPAAHAHQLAALDRELALAADADLTAYLRASGGLRELSRASTLDRHANRARVAVAVGDRSGARAAVADFAHATGSGPVPDGIDAGATAAFTRLLLELTALHTAADAAERAELETAAAGTLATLLEADPAFAWEPLDAAYALRLPWTGEAREEVGRWLAAVGPGSATGRPHEETPPLEAIDALGAAWRAGPARRDADAAAPHGPSALDVGDVAAPYRALAALPGDDPVSEATRRAGAALVRAAERAPTPQDAVVTFVSDGLLAALAAAPLQARAAEALARQAHWPEPLVAHHWRTLAARLDRARTPTEVELLSAHAAACLRVEGDWNAVLLAALLAPLRAALAGRRAGGKPRVAATPAGAAAATAHALTGLGPRALLSHPRVAAFVAGVLVPLSSPGAELRGAEEGEAGTDLLRAARDWVEATGSAADPAALHDLLEGVPEPAARERSVQLWGVLVPLAELPAALARPPRPPVPGWVHGEACP